MATRTTTPKPPVPEEVTKVGNIVDAPVLAFAEGSGKAYTRFSVAVDQPVNGDWKNTETAYYRIVCFDGLAINVAESLDKGARVILRGTPELETWTDKEGNTRTEKKILARDCGPDLRFATANVTRAARRNGNSTDPTPTTGDEEPF
jgi:single-strand DNA-binding protein